MDCNHISKVIEWGYILKDGDMQSKVEVYGCTKCDATSKGKPLYEDADDVFVDHTTCGVDCFGCKAKNIQLNAGDATRDIPDKQWRAKLDNYKKARADGIQPGGTSEAHVDAAYKASETLGKAYQAETMPKAHKINKRIAEVVNSGILTKQ